MIKIMVGINQFKKLIKKIIPSFLISWYHFFLSFLADVIYVFPSFNKDLKVIGVTGTNGKSTVVEMISAILEEAGFLVASSSSIRFKIGQREEKNTLRMTMPGRFAIQRFLKKALRANCQYAILEVTSEGIKQYRHQFIDFDVAVFTNLSPEHIESHGSFEKYRKAKEKLFQATKKIHVINLDDDSSHYFLKYPALKKYGYSLNEKIKREKLKHALIAKDFCVDLSGISFRVDDTDFKLGISGIFNIYNALSAIAVGLSQNVNMSVCKAALEKLGTIPGRMEMVIKEPIKVVVDYAFTPNALQKVYQTIKASFSPRKLICVLGAAGGGRDKWKRQVLGKIADNNCDKIIITNEDPYDEDPQSIIDQVFEGINRKEKAEKALDRREAIVKALKSAFKGDVIVITGKGCEDSICLAHGKRIAWDDRKVVKEEFLKLKQQY